MPASNPLHQKFPFPFPTPPPPNAICHATASKQPSHRKNLGPPGIRKNAGEVSHHLELSVGESGERPFVSCRGVFRGLSVVD